MVTGEDVDVAVVTGVLVRGAEVGVPVGGATVEVLGAALELAGGDDGDELVEVAGSAEPGRHARTQSIFICEDPGPTAGV